jgi:hypothetical protein
MASDLGSLLADARALIHSWHARRNGKQFERFVQSHAEIQWKWLRIYVGGFIFRVTLQPCARVLAGSGGSAPVWT